MAVQMRYGDYVKEGFEVVKANIAPSAVLVLLMGMPIISLAGPIFLVNYMAAVKSARTEGKPIEIGALFNFENALDKWLGLFLCGVAIGLGNLCVIGGIIAAGLLFFTAPILADKPGTPFISAIKASFTFAKGNLVPMIILAFLIGIVQMLGVFACVIGIFVTLPIGFAATFIAYEDHKAAIEAAAAEGGVQLA